MKTIWLDVDGVLLDYTRAFLSFTGIDTLGTTYDNYLDYDLTKLFETPDDCYKAMLAFSMSKKFGELRPIANKLDLEMLHNLGFKLNILTQLSAPPQARANRIRNLTLNFGGVFDKVIFTNRGQCKLDYIAAKISVTGDILVEDNPTLLLKAEDQRERLRRDTGLVHPLTVYAVRHPYNMAVVDKLKYVQAAPDFKTIASWLIHETVG